MKRILKKTIFVFLFLVALLVFVAGNFMLSMSIIMIANPEHDQQVYAGIVGLMIFGSADAILLYFAIRGFNHERQSRKQKKSFRQRGLRELRTEQ